MCSPSPTGRRHEDSYITVITSTTVTVAVTPELWSSPDLLRRIKNYARRPAVDQAVPDTMWYDFVTEAQTEVFADLFSRFPDLQYSAPLLMTTTDGGYTYTFGTDADGDPVYPMGRTQLFADQRSIPDSPLTIGVDFEIEGYLLRVPGNKSRTFRSGPYARFVAMPDVAVSETANPLLFPKTARILLVWKALESWASRPGSGADPTYYAGKYDAARLTTWTQLAASYNATGPHHTAWWTAADFSVGGGLVL